jgi:hypothetical protein
VVVLSCRKQRELQAIRVPVQSDSDRLLVCGLIGGCSFVGGAVDRRTFNIRNRQRLVEEVGAVLIEHAVEDG